MTTFLDITKLSIAFPKSPLPVLREVDLKIERGEYVAVIGHSGCGKSTLLNVVAGLLPATAGGVLLEGREISGPGPDRAVVFQNHSLLPWLTCYENVKLAVDQTLSREMSKAQRHDWVLENLAQYVDSQWLNWGNMTNIAPFYALIIILLIKPYGLFGTKNIERV